MNNYQLLELVPKDFSFGDQSRVLSIYSQELDLPLDISMVIKMAIVIFLEIIRINHNLLDKLDLI
jgi:hypothetical protein